MYIKFNREKSITKRKRKLIELHFEFEFLFYAFWPDYLVNFCVCVAPNDSFLCWKVFFSCSEELKKFFFSRELNTFFLLLLLLFVSFMSILTVPSTLLLSSGRRRLRFFSSLLLPLLHILQHCVLLHTYTRTHARVHTHIRSHTRAYYIHMSRAEHSYVVRVCVRVYRCVLLVWEERVFSVRFATICFFLHRGASKNAARWHIECQMCHSALSLHAHQCACVSVWVWVFVHACMCVLFNQCLKNLVALFEQVILWFSIFSKWQRKMFVIFPHCNNEKCISLALQGIADTNPRVFREIWATLILSGRLI